MKNLTYINILKGLAIFCVVYAHIIPRSSLLARCIYSFHMPLFFMISGFLFNFEEYQHCIATFFKHKTVRLLFPYFVSIFLLFLYWLIFQCPKPFIDTPADRVFGNLSDYALHALYGNGKYDLTRTVSWAGHVGALWFLVALFCTNFLLLFSLKWLHNKPLWLSCVYFGALSALGLWIGKYVFLPWSFDIALAAMFFVFFGFCIKKYNLLEKLNHSKYKWGVVLLLLVIWVLGVHDSWLSMNDRVYKHTVIAYITALSMSFVLFFICFKIQNVKFLKYFNNVVSFVGTESLLIFIFHISVIQSIPGYSLLKYNVCVLTIYTICYVLMLGYVIKVIPGLNRVYYPYQKK